MMANDTQYTHRSRDAESNGSGRRFRYCTSGFGTAGTSGLRRSSRETLLRKLITSSPSSTRKSERLEKLAPNTSPFKRTFEKHKMPSPLKRSDSKQQTSSSSSGSKKPEKSSGSTDMKQNKKREKNVKQWTIEASEVHKTGKHDLKPVGRKRKRMDARTYKSLFKLQRRGIALDVDEEPEKPVKLSRIDRRDVGVGGSKQLENRVDGGAECSGKLVEELREECVEIASEGAQEPSNSSRRGFDAEEFGNHVEGELSYASRKHSCAEEPYKRVESFMTCSKRQSDDNSLAEVHVVQSEERRILSYSWRNLYLLLKMEISRLCETLKLSVVLSHRVHLSFLQEDIRVMANNFLEYVLENHHVNQEPASILHAFQISVCWIAASLLKHKIDRKESILLAKDHLDFSCKEEEANYVYAKLRVLKKMFLTSTDIAKESRSSKDHISAAEDILKEPLDAGESHMRALNLHNLKLEGKGGSRDRESVVELVLSQQEQAFICKMAKKEMPRSVRRVQKKCKRRMTNLLQQQQEEIQGFHRFWVEECLRLEKEHRMESALVRSIHNNISVQMDKLNALHDEFAEKMEDHKHQKDKCFKDLETKHLAARVEEEQKAENWLAEVKSCTSEDRVLNKLPLHRSKSNNKVEHSQAGEYKTDNGPKSVVHVPEHPTEHIPDRIEHSTQVNWVAPAEIPDTLLNETVGKPTETISIPMNPVSVYDDDVEALATGRALFARIEQPSAVGSSSDGTENIVSANLHSFEEQTSDVVPSILRVEEVPLDVSETIPNEVVCVVGSVQIGTTAVVSNAENGRENEIRFDVPNALGIQSDGANCSFNVVSSSQEPSLVNLPLLQPVVSPTCSDLSPQNLALQDEGSQALASTGILDEDATLQGNQRTLQQDDVQALQPVGAGSIDQAYHEAPLLEPLDRLCRSMCIHEGRDQHDLLSANELGREPCSEGHISSQNAESSFLLAVNQAELPGHATSQTGGKLVVHSSTVATQLPLGNNQPDLSLPGRVQNQLSGKFQVSLQNVEAPPQVVEVRVELPNQTVLQPGENLSSVQGFNHVPTHSAHQEAFGMPTLSLYTDPLQNELERLRKETEQAIKVHEDTKVWLKSECDKEIAQIRSKYEAKHQEAEAAFLLKKNEADTNHKKVLMNKMLAEAFKSKCQDLRHNGTLGISQAMPSSLMQPTPRPLVSGLYPAGQPPASQLITPRPPRVHHSAALLSSSMSRTLHISSVTPSTRNLRVGGEIRAPAPHIQPFRHASMSAASLASLPRGIPYQQAPNNLPETAPSHPQLPPQPTPPLPTNHSGPYRRSPQPETARGLPAHSLSLSALELLMDIDNCTSAHQSNSLPPLPDFSVNFGSLDLSEFGALASAHVSSTPSAVAADVFCLSDDD
ncbi:unnamed protein product [Ilex paraguariensis]|uniref:MOM1 alpha-helical domain-containing protein n=1 Tax=Ilex paraguariensis TaxID=185542 RepID=A0ABC8R1W8_9AQUA